MNPGAPAPQDLSDPGTRGTTRAGTALSMRTRAHASTPLVSAPAAQSSEAETMLEKHQQSTKEDFSSPIDDMPLRKAVPRRKKAPLPAATAASERAPRSKEPSRRKKASQSRPETIRSSAQVPSASRANTNTAGNSTGVVENRSAGHGEASNRSLVGGRHSQQQNPVAREDLTQSNEATEDNRSPTNGRGK